MRTRACSVVLAGLVLAACSDGSDAVSDEAPAPLRRVVRCEDAPRLREQAVENRRRRDELTSDQGKISAGNRAVFLTSMALLADLACRVSPVGIDDPVNRAHDAARRAEAASGFYESTAAWSEAHVHAHDAIGQLIRRLPVPPSK
jgi:hypothetical protein